MVVSLSLVLIAGIVLYFMWRAGSVTTFAAIVAITFGFLLAGSSYAPALNQFIDDIRNHHSNSAQR